MVKKQPEGLDVARDAVRRAIDRTALREQTLQGADGWVPPAAPNGHHPEGLFEAEGEDPGSAGLGLDGRPLVTMELTEPERIVFIRRAFRQHEASLQDYTPDRIRACWRIVRELARVSGMVAEDEKLGDMEAVDRDPWTRGGSCPVPDPKDPQARRHWVVVEMLLGREGLPLLPPMVPGQFIDEYGITSDYDPRAIGHDPRLCQYTEMIEYVAKYLRIQEGSILDTNCGVRGLHGLFDVYLVRLAFPSMLQILAWEEFIVDQTLQWMIEKGGSKTRDILRVTYGLREHETRSLIRMALGEAAHRITSGSAEEERALMVMRLERLASAAADKGDERTELGALKQQAIVLGLNKSEPEDLAKEFFAIVSDRANKRKKIRNLQAPPTVITTKALVTDTPAEPAE